MEVVDAFPYACHGRVEGVAETFQRLAELLVLVYDDEGSRLEQGACQHMPHIVMYLTGDAVALFQCGEVYLVVLSLGEEEVLLSKLLVLSCHLIAEVRELCDGLLKTRYSYVYYDSHRSGCKGYHYLSCTETAELYESQSRRSGQPPFLLPQGVIEQQGHCAEGDGEYSAKQREACNEDSCRRSARQELYRS